MIIENKTSWDTKQLEHLFKLVSKHEGYYPRKLYIIYSRRRGLTLTGRATVGPGWVKIGLPNTNHDETKIKVLKGGIIRKISQTYAHELGHNRRLRHKEMITSSKINVNYTKGIKIFRETKKEKITTRRPLKHIKYKGMTIKIFKYPGKIKKYETKKTRTIGIISLFDPDHTNRARRRKELFKSTQCIVIDDVGEKIDPSLLFDKPAPSWILETSPGSQQWGYILDTPCKNR